MLPAARIVVVDDEKDHMQAILDGLSFLGAAAVGVHHFLEDKQLPKFPYLRVLFLDLHLLPGAGSTEQQIKSTIGVMAELLSPENGPYAIVLWSQHSEECSLFEKEVRIRLPQERLPLPLSVISLDKTEYMVTKGERKEVESPKVFREAIRSRINDTPQLAALLSWEEHTSRAAGDVVASVAEMSLMGSEDDSPTRLGIALGELAAASVGRRNVRDRAFRAANEVLVQILFDRMVHKYADNQVLDAWEAAMPDNLSKRKLDSKEAALMNRIFHVETGTSLGSVRPGDRGAVLDLGKNWLEPDTFSERWGCSQETLLEVGFGVAASTQAEVDGKESLPTKKKPVKIDDYSWILVQARAACDQAQRRPGPIPYVLGLCMRLSKSKYTSLRKEKQDAIWLSPIFLDEDKSTRCFAFHLRFTTGVTEDTIKDLSVRYRIREDLLNTLSHTLHWFGGRPGIIQFPG